MERENNGVLLAWFLGGAAIGAAAALLIAPANGRSDPAFAKKKGR